MLPAASVPFIASHFDSVALDDGGIFLYMTSRHHIQSMSAEARTWEDGRLLKAAASGWVKLFDV